MPPEAAPPTTEQPHLEPVVSNPPSNLKAAPQIPPTKPDSGGADIKLMDAPPDALTDGKNLSLRATIAARQGGEKSATKLRQIAEAKATGDSAEAAPTSAGGDEGEPAKEPEKEPEKATPRTDVMTGEPVKETPKVDTKVDTKAAPEPVAEITEAELKAMPAREQKRIKSFITKYATEADAHKATSAKLEAAVKELTELKAQNGKLPESVQKDLDELTKYRRRYDLENDPEVATKFTKRIADGEVLIMDTIKTSPLFGPFVETKIKEAGSFSNFIRSKREYAIQGDKGPEKVTGADIYKRLLETLPISESDIVRQTVADQLRTEKEKARYIEEESAKAKEHFADVEKKQTEQRTQWTARVDQTKAAAASIAKEAAEKLDWLKDEPIAETATKEDKERINESNKTKATLRTSLKSMFENPIIIHAAALASTPQAAEELRDMILDAHRIVSVESELAASKKRIEKLEADLKAARGSSRTTTTTGNVAAAKVTPAGDPNSPARLEGESDLRYSMRTGQKPPVSL